jgi:hypothetical protein
VAKALVSPACTCDIIEILMKGQTMRLVSLASAVTGIVAIAMLSATPAVAGAVCNEVDLSSPCISTSDLKARIDLNDGTQGRLRVKNKTGGTGVELNASNATLTNLFDNGQNKSNGLVKAWAQINADGTIASCWRCNTDTSETRQIGVTVSCEVDFTPLAPDITGRPRLATIDNIVGGNLPQASIYLADRAGDPSSVFVETVDVNGALLDRSFVLIIY